MPFPEPRQAAAHLYQNVSSDEKERLYIIEKIVYLSETYSRVVEMLNLNKNEVQLFKHFTSQVIGFLSHLEPKIADLGKTTEFAAWSQKLPAMREMLLYPDTIELEEAVQLYRDMMRFCEDARLNSTSRASGKAL